jgi:hypothetical protein
MRHGLLSSLTIGTAFMFAGVDFAQAQKVPPAPKAPQIVKKDPVFELKILDYRAREVVQAMLNDPEGYRSSRMYKMSQDLDDPRKVKYLFAMSRQLLAHKDENIRSHGVKWLGYLFPLEHSGLDADVNDIATRLIKRLEDDSSEMVRANTVGVLSKLGRQHSTQQQRCLEALIKASDDEAVEVRSQVLAYLISSMSLSDFDKVRPVIEALREDPDIDIADEARQSLNRLDTLEEQFGPKTTPPAPNNLRP